MHLRSKFRSSYWPYFLITPQIIVILIFFLWPAEKALMGSFFRGDAFGIQEHFVWLNNFINLLSDNTYLYSFFITLLFSFFVTFFSMGLALLMATMLNGIIRGKRIYNALLIWPYAVAPAIAGMLWRFLFSPSIGVLTYVLAKLGYTFNFQIHAGQALFLVTAAASWQQFSYNFVFFLAGLQAIPYSLIEAAAIDGAGPLRRFWSIIFPLLSPTTFFLMVMNFVYSFFNTFGIIQIVTQGGPANATNILVYRVYRDGFIGLNFGSSSAQSVILMAIVILLTLIQFKYIEKRVHY